MVGAATAVPLGAAAMGTRKLVIFDSRLPASLAFARSVPAVRRIDLAEAHGNLFRDLRHALPKRIEIEALTRRSDLVDLRHELARHGLRLSHQVAERGLFRWSMRPR